MFTYSITDTKTNQTIRFNSYEVAHGYGVVFVRFDKLTPAQAYVGGNLYRSTHSADVDGAKPLDYTNGKMEFISQCKQWFEDYSNKK
ncbi:hypothetical protein [Microcystis phage Mel-JY01]